MFKKINNIIFVFAFLAVVFVPFLFTKWESGGVSEEENRNLAAFPSVFTQDGFNSSFTTDFETWFMDHMGFRHNLITANKSMMDTVFNRSLSTSDWKTGKTGDSIYASDEIIKDFAHINLRSEEDVQKIGESYQTVSDWLAQKNIPLFYVQCVDKHTIYPERFIASVNQIGSISKTDQILNYLDTKTTVNSIYLKHPLAENKAEYDVFSHWGDPTHWTDRGAYIGYQYMMQQINNSLGLSLKILDEADYKITYAQEESAKGEIEQVEAFSIKNPTAEKSDVSVMGHWKSDGRHSVWKNPKVKNGKRLLVMGDSYFNSYIIDDIAESFSEVWMVWGDYTTSLPEIVDLCKPDIVIYECAERVDRSGAICDLAQRLNGAE